MDKTEAALRDGGDLVIPMNAGGWSADKVVGEVGEILLGKLEGRKTAEEITMFETVGIAVEEHLASAYLIYQKPKNRGSAWRSSCNEKGLCLSLMTDQGPEETRTLPGSGWTPCLCQCASLQEGCDTVRRPRGGTRAGCGGSSAGRSRPRRGSSGQRGRRSSCCGGLRDPPPARMVYSKHSLQSRRGCLWPKTSKLSREKRVPSWD